MKRTIVDVAWLQLPEATRGLLEQSGWEDSRVLFQALDDIDSTRDLVASLLPLGAASAIVEQHTDHLRSWALQNQDRVQHYRKSKIRAYQDDLEGKTLVRPAQVLDYGTFDLLREKAPKPLPAGWSCRREQLLSTCEAPREREQVEEAERKRWLTALAEVLVECKLPIVDEVRDHPTPLLLLTRIFGAKRSRTLRRRYKTWVKISTWFRAVHGVPYPTGIL